MEDKCLLLKSKVKHQLPWQAPAMLCSTVSTKKPLCVDQNKGSATMSDLRQFVLIQSLKESVLPFSSEPEMRGLYTDEEDGNGLDSCATS